MSKFSRSHTAGDLMTRGLRNLGKRGWLTGGSKAGSAGRLDTVMAAAGRWLWTEEATYFVPQ